VKKLKNCERNMQELSNSIKSPNLIIMGIKKGQEVKAKGICNIFNKMEKENIPNLEKESSIQVPEASMTPNILDQNITSPWHIIIKTPHREQRKNIEGCKKETINIL
jgi:hypothetical protein